MLIKPSTLVASKSISLFQISSQHIETNSKQDVRARLAIARGATLQLIDMWKSTEIGLCLKIQSVKSLVWSVALYGSERKKIGVTWYVPS